MATPCVDTFIQSLQGKGLGVVDRATLDSLIQQYPFFTLPVALFVSHHAPSNDLKPLMARVALNSPDAKTMMMLADRDSDTWINFYPPEKAPEAPTTTDAISTFLNTYGHTSDKETALLEKLIFNPQPEYASTLEEADPETDHQPAETSEQDRLINSFLDAVTAPAPDEKEPEVKETPHSDSLSESLAKIYVKQGKLDKAYEIIQSLNLNFPKKSAYFADQLRFIRKLMINRHQDL